jgi:O-acetyl-ADP-ribose deacetylase (regulator of RNase III)
MNIVIRDRNRDFINKITEAKQMVTDSTEYTIIPEVGDIFDKWDSYERDIALVSPANSFGFMNGGIDAVYIEKFGQQLEDRLRDLIEVIPTKELLVGNALVIPIKDETQEVYEWLIAAPTMRTPQRIIDATDVYLATRAAIRIAITNDITTVLMPGMGTGVGGVPFSRAARNMVMGIHNAFNPVTFKTCAESALDAQKFNWKDYNEALL